MTESTTPAGQVLAALDIPFIEFKHNGLVTSIEQAAAERNQEVSQVVRSILFRCSEGDYFMVLVAGKGKISWKALRQHYKRSRLTTASPAEVVEVTGYELGTVNPFGLPVEIPLILDESVLAQPSVSLGSGVHGTAIMITTKNLLKALKKYDTGKFT
jgi:prolyl-tRNA editing enzyme YbaK/EbsC (Cys-tRNA(Pro) deacylase)